MISALYRYGKKRRRAVARIWAARATAARKARSNAVDADTLRRWDLDWQRGLPVRAIFSGTGPALIACRSRHGRSDQLDVWMGNFYLGTCGPRRLPECIR